MPERWFAGSFGQSPLTQHCVLGMHAVPHALPLVQVSEQAPPAPEHTPVPAPLVGAGQLFGALQQVVFAMHAPAQLYCPVGQPHVPPTPLHTSPPVQSLLEQQVAFAMHALPHAL
jgi:hypothetical protein